VSQEHTLIESEKHAEGLYGGFSFGGQAPDGVVVHDQLPAHTEFPNRARSALLLTFDVEGNCGNGNGDVAAEMENYARICKHLKEAGIAATFNVVGQMVEENGPGFIRWMRDARCEIASHGYNHDLNKRYGGNRVYMGHYGKKENEEQILESVRVLRDRCGLSVRGVRVPYGHFNEHTYTAIETAGLSWASNVGIDDFIVPGQGFGGGPFRFGLGGTRYPVVEIPIDTQTYDWAVWIASEKTNAPFVAAVKGYCRAREIPFVRSPRGAAAIWRRRIMDAVEKEVVFTFICHPINLTIRSADWGDPVEEFLFPVIDTLADLHHSEKAWVCTCGQLARFYLHAREVKS
jgi:peptidoglycan/xylan/chitin deacetylase (PgdA/CDA1 family)